MWCRSGIHRDSRSQISKQWCLCVNLINWERTRDFLSLFFSPECVGKWGENHKYSINSEFWHQEEGVKDVVEF